MYKRQGRDYYALPSPEVLAEAAVEDLEPCRLGYRAKYLIQTAKLVEKERMDVLEALGQPEVTAEEARQSLCRYSGIGPKAVSYTHLSWDDSCSEASRYFCRSVLCPEEKRRGLLC